MWESILRLIKTRGQGPMILDMILEMILELNARPGLSIQIANRAGLLRRTAAVDHLALD